ncbi:hypothetical protein QBC39DRAFT_90965 [Podospora conica]|nr:hypothetical protein QBC39DRAFT_90965 [Schizothecium conicum]
MAGRASVPLTSRSEAACLVLAAPASCFLLLPALCTLQPGLCLSSLSNKDKGPRWSCNHPEGTGTASHCPDPIVFLWSPRSTPDTGPDSMDVESVQHVERNQGSLSASKHTTEGWRVAVSKSSTLRSGSGGVGGLEHGIPASAPTHNTTHSRHRRLATPKPINTDKAGCSLLRGWKLLLFRNPAPLCMSAMSPTPVPASLGGEASVSRNAAYRSSCHGEPALFSGSHALLTGPESKPGHKGNTLSGWPRKREGIPTSPRAPVNIRAGQAETE